MYGIDMSEVERRHPSATQIRHNFQGVGPWLKLADASEEHPSDYCCVSSAMQATSLGPVVESSHHRIASL